MILTNFSIDSFSALIFEGNYFDVHNNFVFIDFIFDDLNKRAEFNFKKSDGAWVPEGIIPGFKIRFENVASVYTKNHDMDYPPEHIQHDGCTIGLFGFSYDGDEIMTGPTDVNARNDLPSLIFVFVTGKAIKIIAETAEMVIHQPCF